MASTVTAKYSFASRAADELSFSTGDVVTVTKRDASGWWHGELAGRTGRFPANYVAEAGGDGAAAPNAEAEAPPPAPAAAAEADQPLQRQIAALTHQNRALTRERDAAREEAAEMRKKVDALELELLRWRQSGATLEPESSKRPPQAREEPAAADAAADAAAGSAPQMHAPARTGPKECRFGAQCKSQDPAHFLGFLHSATAHVPPVFFRMKQDVDFGELPRCRYGENCYRLNPGHFREFGHAKCHNLPKHYYELQVRRDEELGVSSVADDDGILSEVPAAGRGGSFIARRNLRGEGNSAAAHETLRAQVDKMLSAKKSPAQKAVTEFHKMLEKSAALKNPAAVLANCRGLVDKLRDSILEEQDALIKLLLGKQQRGPNLDDFSQLSEIVESVLEDAIIGKREKSRQRLLEISRLTVQLPTDVLQAKVAEIRGQSQSFYGVKDKYQSATNWALALKKLDAMGSAKVPHELLEAMLGAVKAIYDTFKEEHPQDEALGADEFLPIFIYVIVNSAVAIELPVLSEFMQNLCDPSVINGESGYYLVVLTSALHYISMWS